MDEHFSKSLASLAVNQTPLGSRKATPPPPLKSLVAPMESRAVHFAEPGQRVPRGQDDIGVERVGTEAHTRDPVGVFVLPLDCVSAPSFGSVSRGQDVVTITSEIEEEEIREEIPSLVQKRKADKGKEKVNKFPKRARQDS